MDSAELRGLRRAFKLSQRELAFWLLGNPGRRVQISEWERRGVPEPVSDRLDREAAQMVKIFFHRMD